MCVAGKESEKKNGIFLDKNRQFRGGLVKAIGAVDEAVTRGPLMASIQLHNEEIVLAIISPAFGIFQLCTGQI